MHTFHDRQLGELAQLARQLGARMSLDHTTTVVNGNRFSVPAWSQWMPQGYGPQTTGVPQVTPSMPPYLGGSPTNNSMLESVGGYGTAGNNAMAAQIAASSPWSPKNSPVLAAIVGLLLAIFLLKKVHWRDTILEEAGAHASAGPAHAEASESVE